MKRKAVRQPQLPDSPGTAIQNFANSNSLREEIARLAYSYWEARGGLGGSPEDDWCRAEQEIQLRAK
jgi:hypothetical protein